MMQDSIVLPRRGFLIASGAVGAGMALGIRVAEAAQPDLAVPWAGDGPKGAALSAWIEIARDDTVTIYTPQPEIGNGATTQIAMTITEELECAWGKVRTDFASVQRDHLENGVYAVGFQPFFGGHSTMQPRLNHLLQLGASARERLKTAAAERWGVPVGEVVARESVLTHATTSRTLRYGEVASEAAKVTLNVEPKPKLPAEWRLLGKKSFPKLNIPEIVTGRAVYGIDVKVPGMVHAALLQCPVHGGRLKSHDASAVLRMPGVRAVVVVDPAKTRGAPVKIGGGINLDDCTAQHGVAVIADHYWQAKMALDALPVQWDLGEGAKWADADKIYAATRDTRGKEGAISLVKKGATDSVSGSKIVEADYSTPYCENAAMEPLNATILVTADAVEAWVPTQDQQQAFWTIIDETGVKPESVKVHPTIVGGAFGRRTQSDDIRMAAAVAKEFPGRPVKVIWSREETFRQGRYRTPIATKFRAVLDETIGLPASLKADAGYTGAKSKFQLPLGYMDAPYFQTGVIPNVLLTTSKFPVHILNGAYRGPCYNSYAFFVESFIDECAVAAGIDSLEYRIKLLDRWDKSWSDALRLVASKIGWGKQLPKGEGLGIAISCWAGAARNAGSTVATAAHVAVAQDGTLKVKRLDVAFDCGSIVNPDAVRAQLEGATLFGMNAALNEELTVKDGAIVEGNFDEYPMIRMADTPEINVHFEALSGHSRTMIIGEAATGPVQPAIGNAIFAATGKRLRTTPFRKQDLSWT